MADILHLRRDEIMNLTPADFRRAVTYCQEKVKFLQGGRHGDA